MSGETLPCSWCRHELEYDDGGACPACNRHTCITCSARLVVPEHWAGPLDGTEGSHWVAHLGAACWSSSYWGWTVRETCNV